jgi:1A family penicillin-binding protein
MSSDDNNTPWSSLPETELPSTLPEQGEEPFWLPPEPSRLQRFARKAGRVLAPALVILVAVVLVATLAGIGVYASYASSLPSPQELHQRTTPFKSTKIYDRNGRLLFEIFDPQGGRRTVVPYEQLPRAVIDATVATEDATFFTNPGFSPMAIAKALYRDLRAREVVYGASGITQQLVKNIFLTRERTFSRKIKEAILAAEVTRRYSKEEILEIYLNEVYYGNLSYGIGAAAETYFGKRVSQLNLAEAALLAGMLQSPAIYDPYIDPAGTLTRRNTVLGLMRENGYITDEQYRATVDQELQLVPRQLILEAPHMVVYVREQLEQAYGTEVLYRGGLQVYTTLDLDMQHLAEEVARERVEELRKSKASNAALVAMDPKTGDILVMLGSADFNDTAIDGQVNVARSLRQPGSTIKPFTYLTAMEKYGWGPASLVMDVTQSFPDGANPPYKPRNYDDKEYGPISVRMALANSRNIPAVATLHQVGLPAFLEVAHRLGINSLNRPDYGLSLTLGGGEVTLLELTAAYAALDNGGLRVTPRTILRIEDQLGNVLAPETPPEMPKVIDARHAYLLTDILSDNQARTPTFGANSVLKLSFPAAAKTGTTNDYRDSWTMGYSSDLVTGVWVGNSDNTPMGGVAGSSGAGTIWHDFMERAHGQSQPPGFSRPDGLVEVEVCPVSGLKRTELCPSPIKGLYLKEQAPTADCSVHHYVEICRVSGKLATAFCPADSVERRPYEDYGAAYDEWASKRGLAIPPRESCPVHATPSRVGVALPPSPLSGIVQITGSTEVSDFRYYVLDYGTGENPQEWIRLVGETTSPVREGILAVWDTREWRDGVYTVRLIVANRQGATLEARQVVELRNGVPTQEPSSTPTEMATPTAAETPSPTWTLEPPTASPTPVVTLSPTAEPSPTLAESTATPAPPTPLPTVALPTETVIESTITAESPTSTPTETPTSGAPGEGQPTTTPTPPPSLASNSRPVPGI